MDQLRVQIEDRIRNVEMNLGNIRSGLVCGNYMYVTQRVKAIVTEMLSILCIAATQRG
jgi:hypothetical protein